MCRYRIVQDGLPLLLPHVTRQLLQPTVTELLHLIEGRSLYVPEEARGTPPVKLTQGAQPVAAEAAAPAEAAAVKEEAGPEADNKQEQNGAHIA